MVFPHFQTKNSHTDALRVAPGETLEYGQIVNYSPAGDNYDVSPHGGGTGVAGVVTSGVTGSTFTEGEVISVQNTGIVLVKLATAILKGQGVGPNANGFGIVHTGGTNALVGVALHDRAAGEFVEVNISAKS